MTSSYTRPDTTAADTEVDLRECQHEAIRRVAPSPLRDERSVASQLAPLYSEAAAFGEQQELVGRCMRAKGYVEPFAR